MGEVGFQARSRFRSSESEQDPQISLLKDVDVRSLGRSREATEEPSYMELQIRAKVG